MGVYSMKWSEMKCGKKKKKKKKNFFKGLFLGKVCADPLGGKAKQTPTGEMR